MLIDVPGGEVSLRDDRTGRRWQVQVRRFLLGRHPVTRADYLAVTGGAPELPADGTPVVNVSWNDAVSFCNLLSDAEGLSRCYTFGPGEDDVRWDREASGYRLPTEAEWQHACKAGTPGYRYADLDDIAWYDGNAGGRIRPSGEKAPNPWGLHDMLGNVWEWCWDLYDPEVYGSYRIFRGGSWADEGRSCGATCRRRSHPTFRIDDVGFRIARSAS